MRVLITGIDGFVGSHLVEALVTDPDVRIYGTVVDDRHPNISGELLSQLELFKVDIRQPDKVRQVISTVKPSKIFHLAGQAFVPISLENPAETFHVNINGTLNVLEAIREASTTDGLSCSVLVVSSGEVYGAVSDPFLPIDETVPLKPESPYAASKACADLIAQQYRSSFGIDVVVARPFNHLGPRQSELFVGSAFAKQIAEMEAGKREPKLMVGNLDPERDFTDVRDVVRAYMKILDRPRAHPVYNVCSGTTVTVKEVVRILCEVSGVRVEIVPDTTRQRRNDIPKSVGSAARLRAETGWYPKIPLRQTLEDVLKYWENRVRTQG